MSNETRPGEMTPEKLYDTLRGIQEKRGYYFNKNREYTLELLEQLLANKSAFGYMACPCRLANGTLEEDKDIVCPCAYREADVKEYGCCYCELYTGSEDGVCATAKGIYVPDRRSGDRIKMELFTS